MGLVAVTWSRRAVIACAVALVGVGPGRAAEERSIVLASTSTTQKTGLFEHLLPAFTSASGIQVKLLASSTAQALDAARRGEADVVLVHDPVDEARFLAEGYGLPRQEAMRNDYLLIGPAADPARVKGRDAVAALARLAAAKGPFVSRADQSGTHAAELRLWKAAGIEQPQSAPLAYQACNCGTLQALARAAATQSYVLADRGSWLMFKERADLAVLVEGDERLANPFALIVVNPAKQPKAHQAWAQTFADWVMSPAGQSRIASLQVQGTALFQTAAAP